MPDVPATVPAPTPAEASAAVRPGYKTTEFWLTVVAQAVGLVLASGVVVPGGGLEKIIGGAIMVLGLLGYQVTRAQVKKSA